MATAAGNQWQACHQLQRTCRIMLFIATRTAATSSSSSTAPAAPQASQQLPSWRC
jgi:hypothetical protein